MNGEGKMKREKARMNREGERSRGEAGEIKDQVAKAASLGRAVERREAMGTKGEKREKPGGRERVNEPGRESRGRDCEAIVSKCDTMDSRLCWLRHLIGHSR